jgi:uncharacterized protein (DUF362 family)
VDGIVVLGKTPRKLNLVMASSDVVATDFVAAKIAGLNPRRIKYISESEKLGVGSTTKVRLVGDDLSSFSKLFPRKSFSHKSSRSQIVKMYGLYQSLFTLEGRVLKLHPTWWD